MLSYTREIIGRAEAGVGDSDIEGTLSVLRQLPIDDFGTLFLTLPNPEYPALSSRLPAMAAAEVQRTWTGEDGFELLRKTLSFTRITAYNFLRHTGRDLANARILDFGCGYGRILRTMYYFTNPSNLHGCDPWNLSIDLCRQAGILGHLEVSDYLPQTLPFGGNFDLIYAFSVFTHLSERATRLCLNVLADALSPDGMLVITIRPIEYWQIDAAAPESDRLALTACHEGDGFAFWPHVRERVDGDITYGDTSMSLEYLQKNFPKLTIVSIERTLDDPYQLLVFLTKQERRATDSTRFSMVRSSGHGDYGA